MTAPNHRPMLVSRLDVDADPANRAPRVGAEPARELLGNAAELLASAGALRAAAQNPGAAATLGPTLACLESSLDALAAVARLLGDQAVEPAVAGGTVRSESAFVEAEVQQRFHHLVAALDESRVACRHAQVAVGHIHIAEVPRRAGAQR